MEAWNAFLRNLEHRLGKQPIRKWVRPLKVLNYDAGNLYLDPQNSFQITWFEEHIRPIAKKEFVNNNGRPIVIHLGERLKKGRSLSPSSPCGPSYEIQPDPIDPSLTFSNFVFDENNRITVEFLRNLEPGSFNPLFLWGERGIGKTHLFHAVAANLRRQGLSVFFVHSETFTRHVVEAIRSSSMRTFRAIYRRPDVLIVDDVHCFARRSATQEEFFHTFNALHTSGKQILLASHLLPRELEEIEPRLISRFEWGIVLDLTTLDREKMEAVLKNRAQVHHFPLSEEMVQFLTASFPSTPKSMMRALEALMIRHRCDRPIAVKEARQVLSDLLIEERKTQLTTDKILSIAAAYYGIRTEDILGPSQVKECAIPRKIAMYLCRKYLALSYQALGRYFHRDHSTVITAIRQVEKKSLTKEIEAALLEMEKEIKS